MVKMVYETINNSDKFKRDYRLREQVTDAVVSVMSNIAEGFSRQSIFYIGLDLGYITEEVFNKAYNQADKVSKISSGLIRYLFSQRK